jgi:hypothetical protein
MTNMRTEQAFPVAVAILGAMLSPAGCSTSDDNSGMQQDAATQGPSGGDGGEEASEPVADATLATPDASDASLADATVDASDGGTYAQTGQDGANAGQGDAASTDAATQSDGSDPLFVGLVAYYPFDGDALDHSGNGNDCAVMGATLTTDRNGQPNAAYSFEGSSYMDCGDGPSIDISGDLTLSAWFSSDTSSLTGYNQVLVGRGANSAGWYILEMQNQDQSGTPGFCGPTHSPGLVISGNGVAGSASSACVPNPIAASAWHLATGVFHAGQQLAIYLDGQLASSASTTIQAPKNGSGADLLIGKNISIPTYFNGVLDDIRVYNRALSDAEIAALYAVQRDAGPTDAAASDAASE